MIVLKIHKIGKEASRTSLYRFFAIDIEISPLKPLAMYIILNEGLGIRLCNAINIFLGMNSGDYCFAQKHLKAKKKDKRNKYTITPLGSLPTMKAYLNPPRYTEYYDSEHL